MKTKKCLIKCFALFVLTFFITVFTVNAQDFEIDSNGVLVSYNGPGGDVVIPDGVTAIGGMAFGYNDSLTSVTIPESVTSIGDSAFWYCQSLMSITIPGSVTTIEDYAFVGDYRMTSITIFPGVTSIGYHAFSDCTGLMSITIPDSLISIGAGAIEGSTYDHDNKPYWYSKRDKTWINIRTGIADSYYAYDYYNTPKTTSIVVVDPDETVVSNKSISVYQDEYQLSGSASPEDALQRFSWKSSNRNIAEVDRDGKVTFKKEGSVRITAMAVDESNKSSWVDLTRRPRAETITILNDIGEVISGQEINITEQTCQLVVQITPANALQQVDWFRDNMIASVSSDHLVTFNTYGSIILTAKTKDGSGLSAKVKLIYGPPEDKVKIWESSGTDITGKVILTNRSGCQLKASVPSAEGVQNFTWESNDNTTATVDSSGKVSFKKTGTVTITARIMDGSGKSADVTLTYMTVDNALMLPWGLKVIQASAFESSNSFKTVIVPDGVSTINDRAFANCSGLELVYIPDSVRSIGENVFENDSDVVLVCQSDNTCAAYARSQNIAYQIGYWY